MIFNKKSTYEQHDNEKGSFYKSSVKPLNSSDKLIEDLKVDVCIIGGGFTGISTAFNLQNKGYSIALCEARTIGSGASGRNGGQLGIGMRKDQFFLEKKLGKMHAKDLWDLGLAAVDEALYLINKYNINCSLVNGVLSAGCFDSDYKNFDFEINHLLNKYNFNDLKIFNKEEIKNQIASDIYKSGLLNTRSYHINPLKFLINFANLLIKQKVKIFENTPVIKIEEYNNYILVHCHKHKLKAKKVVVACNGYLDNLLNKKRKVFMPINNYIIATEPLGREKAMEIIKNNYAVCDTRFIIDYYRFSEDWRLIFGGGETFSSYYQTNSKNFVFKRMMKVFPQLKDYKIDFSWGGTLAITINRLPSFGTAMNEKLLYAFGYSGHGLALSILAGKLISEKIEGKSERFDLFSKIKHITIPCGNIFRRPIYSSAIFYYKLRDLINYF
tara:strand:- start:152 stop:1474 length:1323 start_codon:yes stop_codon:yes gene_type:complete